MTIMPETSAIAHPQPVSEWEGELGDAARGLGECVRAAVQDSVAISELEKDLVQRLRALGRYALGWFLEQSGDGDLGEVLELPEGQTVKRLSFKRQRPYQSVFGDFEISRWVYGSRNGQRIEHIPLDSRLDLPRSKVSYLLQEWSQLFVVDQAFKRASENLETVLGAQIPVHTLERISRNMAEDVVDYWDGQKAPPSEEEGEVVVATADFKGIPMKGGGAVPEQARTLHGDKDEEAPEGKKQMALVGGVYTIDRYVRSPQEVLEALFRDGDKAEVQTRRPAPCHKWLRTSLERDEKGTTQPALAEIFGWMDCQIENRDPGGGKPVVALMDGQGSLWDAATRYIEVQPTVEILDLLHVTPRIWEAAKLFYSKAKTRSERLLFVKKRVARILDGEVEAVVLGLRSMATRRRLGKKKRKKLERICGYLEHNADRMRYDEYLAAGYPIATGVIEGACRHLVKDRLERSGMRWVPEGAQALLDLRCVRTAGLWEEFQDFRRAREQHRLYPFRGQYDRQQLRLVN